MERVPLLILGAGGVGRALMRQIVRSRKIVSRRASCRFEAVMVVDSKSWVRSPEGLTDSAIMEMAAAKDQQGVVGERRPDLPVVLAQFIEEFGESSLIVDVTAESGMESIIDQALAAKISVALANKKPLTGAWLTSQSYFNNPLVRYEATVGGGLPLIRLLQTLLDSGERVLSIEGQMSGTLNGITRQMDEGVSFSDALGVVMAHGVSEPDPRDDLDGWDARRKLAILGRTCGWPLEISDMAVESLVPPKLAKATLGNFLDSIKEMDGRMRDRVNSAQASGQVLRYMAHVDSGGGSIGLKNVPLSDPGASTKLFTIRTERYRQLPLYIGSNTSGPETTAAGVLGDMVALARR